MMDYHIHSNNVISPSHWLKMCHTLRFSIQIRNLRKILMSFYIRHFVVLGLVLPEFDVACWTMLLFFSLIFFLLPMPKYDEKVLQALLKMLIYLLYRFICVSELNF